jgi:hypothetical protein
MRDLGITPPAAPAPSAGVPSVGAPSVGAPTPVESQPSASEMDWLDQLREQSDIPEQPELDTTPEWLSALGLPTPGEAQAAQPSAASSESEAPLDELPDWLKQMDAGAESKPHGIEPPGAEPRPPTPAETSEPSEEPDWLSGLRESAQAETPPPEPGDWLSQIEPSSASASGEPDWLTTLRGQTPESSADQPEWLTELSASTPAPSTELPGEMDWSSGMEQPADAAPAEEPEALPEAPDWLKDIAAAPLPTESPAPPETEVPEWLRDITIATPAAPEPSEAPITSAFIGEDELVDQVETPDWLSGIDQPVAPMETESAQPVEIPAWLRDLGPLPAGVGPAVESLFGELAPAAPGEVPEWLQQRQAGQPQPAFADEAGHPMAELSDQAPGATGLEAATIPSWLEALRPHEAVLQAEVAGEGVAETEGILMGLSNVLPASALMGQMHSAPAVTKAEPSPTDLARASLFQEMLGRGSLTPVVVTRARRTLGMGDRIARWLIAALFIVLVLIPNFRTEASRLFQLSLVDAREFKPAADQIETLNAGDRVLMVFDYDASQAGEMNAIAEAFVRHIGLRGAEVIVDSLNPVGTALAQQVRAKIAGGESPAPPFVNQGYVPGQAVGVQRILASTPVNVIVVLAGSPDSLRWWLEQVAASRLTTPVIAGLSAAALPQALPYRQSGQISATVSGLMAGLAYQRSLDPEEDANQDGLDRIARSEALYLSQLTFAAILLVGAIVSLVYRPRPSA